MRLLKLGISGLRSFTEPAEIDLDKLGQDGLFAICGPTGAGKSTILDAIFLALFGRCPRGEPSECVAASAVDMSVRLEIGVVDALGPRRLCVTRRFHWTRRKDAPASALGAEMRGSPKHPPLRIEAWQDGAWAPVDTGGMKPDEYLLREIVRVSMSDFQQAVVLPQGEFDALLNARPAERRTLLSSLFRTEHLGQPLIDVLRAKLGEVQGELDRLSEVLREIAVSAKEAVDAEIALTEAQAEAVKLDEALVIADKRAAALRLERERCAARDKAKDALAAAEARRAKRAQDRVRLERAQRAFGLEAALLELESLEEAVRVTVRQTQVAEERARESETRTREAELAAQAAAQRAEDALARVRVSEDERAEASARLLFAELREAKAKLGRLEASERAASEERVRVVAGHIAGAASELALDLRPNEPCPVCGSLVHPDQKEPSAQVKARVTQAAAMAAERMSEAEPPSPALLEARAEVERLHKRAMAALDALPHAARVRANGAKDESVSAAEARVEALTRRAREASQLERTLGHAREGLAAAARARATAPERPHLSEARAALLRQGEAIGQRERAYEAMRAGIAEAGFANIDELRRARMEPSLRLALAAELEALEREIEALEVICADRTRAVTFEVSEEETLAAERARADAQQAAFEAKSRVARASERRDELQRRRMRALEFEAKIALLAPRAQRLGRILKVVASNQLAEIAAEHHTSAVTSLASQLLGVLSKGRYALVRNENGAFVVADGAYGGLLRPPSTLSGGETFLVSLALALALSERIQLAGRTRFDFFFLDEGFGSLDAATVEIAMSALEELRGRARIIGMISHVPAIEERMPRRLRVLPGHPGASARILQEPAEQG